LKRHGEKILERLTMEEKRELRDFVEDLISDGRVLVQILAVGQSSRWNGLGEEIEKIYEELKKSLEALRKK